MWKHLFKSLVLFSIIFGFYKIVLYLYKGNISIINVSEVKAPAIIIEPYGGLGNQLFRYACAYNLAKKYQLKLYLPINIHKKSSFNNEARDYALDFFQVPQINITDKKQLNSITLPTKNVFEQDIIHNDIPNDKILILNDYCESEIFFKEHKEEIIKVFEFREDKISEMISNIPRSEQIVYRDIIKDIENTASVCVHVRRGDTASFKYWTIPISYQIKAMKLINAQQKNPIFYIFSDDINYAKNQLKQFTNMILVSEHNFPSIIDFYLMTKCKHNIIANSTFSWWAGYLNNNPNKIIIAPLPKHQDGWYEEIFSDPEERKHRKYMIDNFSYPKSWITINPFEDEKEELLEK